MMEPEKKFIKRKKVPNYFERNSNKKNKIIKFIHHNYMIKLK